MTDEQKKLTIEQLERVSGKLGAIGETVDYTELAIEALEQTDVLEKIRAEIEEKYGDYDICEWFNNYDYEENDISEYQLVGKVSDILKIIDRYKAGSEG